jgi:hypothetical protein
VEEYVNEKKRNGDEIKYLLEQEHEKYAHNNAELELLPAGVYEGASIKATIRREASAAAARNNKKIYKLSIRITGTFTIRSYCE